MLSGPLQGSLLYMLVKLTGARRILEIGSFTGYSALWMGMALPEDGMLHTIEKDEKLLPIATRYIAEAGLQDKIAQYCGPAADVIQTLDGMYDLVFLDADKKGYEAYFEAVLPKMPVGGLLLADNVLFRGEVVMPEGEQGAIAQALHCFNQKLAMDTRVEAVLLPLRDGLTLVRKLH
jgi:predicted O-methyltransferase YrrM